MKILILSASTGGGHMTAANAIKRYISKFNNDNVDIVDSLEYISPILNLTVTKGYVYLATKKPKLYGALYRLTNEKAFWSNVVLKINRLFSNKLIPLIRESSPDIIITTHPFPTAMISLLKENKLLNIPLVCIMTDYAPHKAWINEKVDAYIIGSDNMIDEMIELGVTSTKIYPYGIPIDEVFFKGNNKKEILKELALNETIPTILIMAGSFGVNNIFKIYERIEALEERFQIIIITGKNKKLYDDFKIITKYSKREIKLIYFTNEVSKYMEASDIIITKPGGLTITEALACNIPMAIFNAIPGQEEENAQFLINNNMAIKIDDSEECSKIIKDLLKDKVKLTKMKIACKNFENNKSIENLYSLINNIIINK